MDKYGSSYINSYFDASTGSDNKKNAWKDNIKWTGKLVTNSYDDNYALIDAFNIDWESSYIQVAGSYVTSSAHLAYLIDYSVATATPNIDLSSYVPLTDYQDAQKATSILISNLSYEFESYLPLTGGNMRGVIKFLDLEDYAAEVDAETGKVTYPETNAIALGRKVVTTTTGSGATEIVTGTDLKALSINGHFLPDETNTYTLGSSDYAWKAAYAQSAYFDNLVVNGQTLQDYITTHESTLGVDSTFDAANTTYVATEKAIADYLHDTYVNITDYQNAQHATEIALSQLNSNIENINTQLAAISEIVWEEF